jgi:hypothetical protein
MHVGLLMWVKEARKTGTHYLSPMVEASFEDHRIKVREKLMHSWQESRSDHEIGRHRHRWKYKAARVIVGTIFHLLSLVCIWMFADPLRSGEGFMDNFRFVAWILFILANVATSLPFVPGFHLVLIGIGYVFGVGFGVLLAQLSTLFGIFSGHLLTLLWFRNWLEKNLELFPSFMKVKIYAFLDPGITNCNWEKFKRICALRTNLLELPFGWVNGVIAIGNVPLSVVAGASLLSMQPSLVIWVSVGRILEAFVDSSVSGARDTLRTSARQTVETRNAEVTNAFICMIIGLVVRLVLAYLSATVMHRSDWSLAPSGGTETRRIIEIRQQCESRSTSMSTSTSTAKRTSDGRVLYTSS